MLELTTAIHATFDSFKSFLFGRGEDRVPSPIKDRCAGLISGGVDTLRSEQDHYKSLSALRLLSDHIAADVKKNLLTIPQRVRNTGPNEEKRKAFLSLLLGDDVVGAINTKQRCPTCNGHFSEIDNNGLYCPKCKTRPTRYYITAKKIGIPFLYSAPVTREPFETYGQALKVLMAINHTYQEALSQGRKFDLSKWLPSEFAEKLIENLCKRWLKNYEPEVANRVKSKDYVDSLHTLCNSFIVPYFKGKHIDYIDENHIERFYHWLLDKKYSTDYIDTILKTLKALFIKYRPKDIPHFPTITVVPVREKQRLGLARELAILEHIPERNGYRLAILLLIRTGMHINEIPAIKKKDCIDGIIYVDKAMSDGHLRLRRKAGGEVPYRMTPELWELVLEHIVNLDEDDFLFTVEGRNVTRGRLYKVWTKACKKAKVKHISLQQASRHSTASRIWEKHQEMAKIEIKEQLGHENTRTGKKHYVIE